MRVAILKKRHQPEEEEAATAEVVIDIVLDGAEGFLKKVLKSRSKPAMWLQELLHRYPELVKVVLDDNNEYELRICRPLLVHAVEEDKFDINFPSFERGLKHIGFYCTQTTHGGNVWKTWKLKKEPPKAVIKSKIRKTHNDDDIAVTNNGVSVGPEVLDDVLKPNTRPGKLLRECIREYPDMIQVVLVDDDSQYYEIHVNQALLVDRVTGVYIQSLENGLRYAGFCCPRSKHCSDEWKIWKLKQ